MLRPCTGIGLQAKSHTGDWVTGVPKTDILSSSGGLRTLAHALTSVCPVNRIIFCDVQKGEETYPDQIFFPQVIRNHDPHLK